MATFMIPGCPGKFKPALRALERLSKKEWVIGIFVYGSVARGDADPERSDFDFKVLVNEKACASGLMNQFCLGDDVRLEMQVFDWASFERRTEQDLLTGENKPFLLESVILYDPFGKLAFLKSKVLAAEAPRLTGIEIHKILMRISNEERKIKRFMEIGDAEGIDALFESEMTVRAVVEGLSSKLVHFWFRSHRLWPEDFKKFPAVMRAKDPVFFQKLYDYFASGDLEEKIRLLREVCESLLVRHGGLKDAGEFACKCPICKKALSTMKQ